MRTFRFIFMLMGLMVALTSACMAEDWYLAMERSSNDYRDSVETMATEVDGAGYTPHYTHAELQATRAIADARQVFQQGVVVAQASSAVSVPGPDMGGESFMSGVPAKIGIPDPGD